MEKYNTSGKELGLYLHIPFCTRKCHYCDFLSAPAQEDVRQAYIDQMLREIRASAVRYPGFRVRTIFIGGGTPSVLTASQVQRLLGQVMECFSVSSDAEITIECNPGTLDAQKLRIYLKSGINRLSIGLQSANNEELELLGRIHTYEQFVSNYAAARETGFENINIDLMSALPGQDVRAYEKTLRKVTALKPEHISAYSLLIEEGTPFYTRYGQAQAQREKGQAQHLLPSEEEDRAMYTLTKELLHGADYDRYEISNYARTGFACRHNIGYWTRQNYLGFGIGAASMVENVRFSNQADLKKYLASDFMAQSRIPEPVRIPQAACSWTWKGHSYEKNHNGNDVQDAYCMQWHENKEYLSKREQMEEFMFLGLRMMCGISSGRFYDQFSLKIEAVYGEIIQKQQKEKLLKKTETGYALTDSGIDVSNYVLSGYLLDKIDEHL